MEYLEYLPEFLRCVREFRRLGEGLFPAVQELTALMEQAGCEGDPDRASEEGIRRFEKALGLTPGSGDTLEQRRFRILGVFGGNPPFSMGWLREKLQAAYGEGGWTAEASPEEYRLVVGVNASAGGDPQVLRQELREKIPANLTLSMKGIHPETTGIFVGAVLQTEAIYQLEVEEDGAVSS